MPKRLIDSQISQNVSTAGAVAIPASTTPALFGTLGLDVAAAGPNLSVHFTATVTLSAVVSILVPVTVTIFRVVGGVSTLIYSATETMPVGTLLLTTDVLTVTGIDLLTTNPGFVVYQAFVSIPGGLAVIPDRVGPESFEAVAYSD
ncbi:hypothetical protein J2TS6_49180 [Paenibacillus albilobatus]|uniref:Uncharacterized protein n=1 Tax=Paenibacillus albilobatus TaxID=2716884 RepID=A0A920CEH7_9BACL|nr:hypothetical protein [Paenibacillus albilobatus]GIO33777.1 hypothetical protein J2TS6_49180 [Paenibacillus albilobatus]